MTAAVANSLSIDEDAGGGDHLFIEMNSSDPKIRDALTRINDLAPGDPLRHECEAMLYMSLAKTSWREAERCRRARARRSA